MRVLVSLSLFLVWWMILNVMLFQFGDFGQDAGLVAFFSAIPTTILSIYLFRHFRHKPREFQ